MHCGLMKRLNVVLRCTSKRSADFLHVLQHSINVDNYMEACADTMWTFCFQVGDRIAMEPGIACNVCTSCKEGRYNLCEEMKFFATPPVHGSLANEIVHPAGASPRLTIGSDICVS